MPVSEKPSTVQLRTDRTNFTFEKLPPGKYRAWIRGNFSGGLGPISDPVELVLYPEEGGYRMIMKIVSKATSEDKEQKRSTEGCSKFKSPDTRQVQERLVSTLEHMQVPKWDRTRCPEE